MKLSKESNTKTTFYIACHESWKYTNEHNGVLSIIDSITSKDAYLFGDSTIPLPLRPESKTEIKDIISKAKDSLLKIAKATSITTPFVSLGIGDILTRKDTNKYYSILQSIITKLTNRTDEYNNSHLVVLIDDLDRCHTSAILHLLTSLVHMLQHKNCTFIVAFDKHIAALAVEHEFNIGSAIPDFGHKYLEKLFTKTFLISQYHNNYEIAELHHGHRLINIPDIDRVKEKLAKLLNDPFITARTSIQILSDLITFYDNLLQLGGRIKTPGPTLRLACCLSVLKYILPENITRSHFFSSIWSDRDIENCLPDNIKNCLANFIEFNPSQDQYREMVLALKQSIYTNTISPDDIDILLARPPAPDNIISGNLQKNKLTTSS